MAVLLWGEVFEPPDEHVAVGGPRDGEYVPQAPINDEAKQHNENLPGLGGVYNYINLHAYHYAGNNPVVLVDPDESYIGLVTCV